MDIGRGSDNSNSSILSDSFISVNALCLESCVGRKSVSESDERNSVEYLCLESCLGRLPEGSESVGRACYSSSGGMSKGYTIFPRRVANMRRGAWCTLDDLWRFVDDNQHIGFHIRSNRQKLVEAYSALRQGAPFSRTQRFPENETWVHLDSMKISQEINQVLNACDLPDRLIEKGKTSSTEEMGMSSLSDAKRAFEMAFRKLWTYLRVVEESELMDVGIYEREYFESAFGLLWTE
uniref:Uncharacterized protein n=1 Tax=Xiangshan martelli-like virus 3 TaxID=2886234 RepID=A0A8K1YQR2_9VIRU|nr:MAG: hypothetical protein [Xiangshan martelli-like virus 3]